MGQGVITNPADFDEPGKLHVRPYHQTLHGCPLCPANLCKGTVLEELRKKCQARRVIYVGDGGGDFCPACELGPNDAVLCRTPPSPPLDHFGLHRRIQRAKADAPGTPSFLNRRGEVATVVAQVCAWHSGDDVLKIMSSLLCPS